MGIVYKKQIVAFSISMVILIGMFFVPEHAHLTVPGIRTIGLVLAFLAILIADVLPLIVTCWLFLALMPLLGASASFTSALSGFSNQVIFFILASLGIASAFTAVPLSKRILAKLLQLFGKSINNFLFAMMLSNTIITSVVSSVATTAIFMAIASGFLELYEDEEERKRTGRAFMIAIPLTSIIGGMMTPAGSSVNLLAIDLLEKFTGQTITFMQWMGVGIPLTMVTLPIAWLLMVKVYRPAEISAEHVKAFTGKLGISPRMSAPEVRVLVITGVMMTFWILSSWFRSINVAVVSLAGCCVLFFPKIGVLNWNTFIRETKFDAFFLVGTVLCLGNAMVGNGVSDWIITILPTVQMGPVIFTGFVVLIVFVTLIVIPVAPSLVTIMASPLIAMGVGAGYSAPMIMITLGLAASNCYLLPLDTVLLITYGGGYYSMTDLPKSTALLQLFLVIVMALWIPLACRLVGM